MGSESTVEQLCIYEFEQIMMLSAVLMFEPAIWPSVLLLLQKNHGRLGHMISLPCKVHL